MSKIQCIPGPVGRLETMLTEPEQAPVGIAVICHPHPLHGGTMHNKVVTALAKACLAQQALVLRFNYRGVEGSEGEFDCAKGELDDCRVVIEWARQQYPGLPVWLAGFSFGAYIATQVAHDDLSIQRCIAIAPAIKHYRFDALTQLHCPWLVVQGDQDEVVPCESVQRWWALSEKQADQKLHILLGAGHFFHGRLIELRDIVRDWLAN